MYKPTEQTLGSFVEKDYGKDFTYSLTTNKWALSHGMIHEIDVCGQVRFGLVKKTVAYVCTDEESDGTPALEKWQIKQHVVFQE